VRVGGWSSESVTQQKAPASVLPAPLPALVGLNDGARSWRFLLVPVSYLKCFFPALPNAHHPKHVGELFANPEAFGCWFAWPLAHVTYPSPSALGLLDSFVDGHAVHLPLRARGPEAGAECESVASQLPRNQHDSSRMEISVNEKPRSPQVSQRGERGHWLSPRGDGCQFSRLAVGVNGKAAPKQPSISARIRPGPPGARRKPTHPLSAPERPDASCCRHWSSTKRKPRRPTLA
jgi:hypothetical protein